jgi:hypothetical protein
MPLNRANYFAYLFIKHVIYYYWHASIKFNTSDIIGSNGFFSISRSEKWA